MIICHEGLPRSGKSYEACAYQILPALKEGRRVVTNIDGVNHKQFSELSGIPLSWVEKNLICVYDKDLDIQKARFLKESGKDALIVIDEIQNLFPTERNKLSEDWSYYVTEHGHNGLDIIVMTQDRRDMHSIWRRRIQRVFTFNKLAAIGKENSYRWECFEATRPEKYKLVTQGSKPYEKEYFGLYKSHTDSTANKGNFADKRANVLNNKNLRYGLVATVVALYFAVTYLVGFFSSPAEADTAEVSDDLLRSVPAPLPIASPDRVQSQAALEPKSVGQAQSEEKPPIDIFDKLARSNRVRLSGYVQSFVGDGSDLEPAKRLGFIDVMDSNFRLKDRFTIEGIVDLGWQVTSHSYGLRLLKQGKEYIATPWPIEPFGRVSDATRERLGPERFSASAKQSVNRAQRPRRIILGPSSSYEAINRS